MFYDPSVELSHCDGSFEGSQHVITLRDKKNCLLIILMCLSIGTPKNNKFSICPKWKIHYFQVSQNLGRVQPHYNVLEYSDT